MCYPHPRPTPCTATPDPLSSPHCLDRPLPPVSSPTRVPTPCHAPPLTPNAPAPPSLPSCYSSGRALYLPAALLPRHLPPLLHPHTTNSPQYRFWGANPWLACTRTPLARACALGHVCPLARPRLSAPCFIHLFSFFIENTPEHSLTPPCRCKAPCGNVPAQGPWAVRGAAAAGRLGWPVRGAAQACVRVGQLFTNKCQTYGNSQHGSK